MDLPQALVRYPEVRIGFVLALSGESGYQTSIYLLLSQVSTRSFHPICRLLDLPSP